MTTRAGCPSGAAFKQVLTNVCISGGLGPRCAGGLEVFTGGEDLCEGNASSEACWLVWFCEEAPAQGAGVTSDRRNAAWRSASAMPLAFLPLGDPPRPLAFIDS